MLLEEDCGGSSAGLLEDVSLPFEDGFLDEESFSD